MNDEMTFDRDPHSAYQRAEQVKQRYEADILSKANVIGVGVGLRSRQGKLTEEVAIIVLVTQKQTRIELADEDWVPRDLEGVPVDVQAVGEIDAH